MATKTMRTTKNSQKSKSGIYKDFDYIIVSAAEPYTHIHTPNGIEFRKAANGIITGIEPILKLSGGLCIAHGRGNADRDVVDANDKIKLPPYQNQYTVKRMWISKKDFQTWYNGFSTEMLYTLCLNAFERPTFREVDWKGYERVNHQFADSVLAEAHNKKTIVWIQDIQFALLPKILREKNPDLIIAHFWHIPWPVADVFNICPWKKEILEGMLGNSLLGFHSMADCKNFLDSVSKTLEAKVDYNALTVTYNNMVTHVQPFPLGIDYQAIAAHSKRTKKFGTQYMKKFIDSRYEYLMFGVERLNYVKGLAERFHAIDRFLEKYPEYQEKFVSFNVLVPSKTLVKKNEDYADEIETLIDSINYKYSTSRWQPIHIIKEALPQSQIYNFYKSSDICIVTSLADGMNLVSKEYIAGGADDGALILSDRTGAVHELSDAHIVNPYDIERLVDSIKEALETPKAERIRRMERMRDAVAKNNVYTWAEKFINRLIEVTKK